MKAHTPPVEVLIVPLTVPLSVWPSSVPSKVPVPLPMKAPVAEMEVRVATRWSLTSAVPLKAIT